MPTTPRRTAEERTKNTRRKRDGEEAQSPEDGPEDDAEEDRDDGEDARGTLRRETPSSDDLKIRIKFEVGLTDGDFGVLPGEDVEAPEAAPYRIFPTKTLETLADGVLKNLRKREGSIVSAAPGTGARTAALVAADRQVLKRNASIVIIAAPAGLVQHWRHVLKTLNATFSVHKAVPAKWVNRVPVIVVPFADFWKDAELLCREVKPKILIVDGALGLAANASDWDDVMPFALSGIPVVALDTAGGFERAPADVGVRMLKAVAPKVKLPSFPKPRRAARPTGKPSRRLSWMRRSPASSGRTGPG